MSLNALYDVAAPAKLNLFLHIVGRRTDGYHLLQSVFCLIDWCDTLHFELRRDGRIARRDLSAALPTDDLCLRAARALQEASRCDLGVDIAIDKQVPWGAGMGGGSSDAASTLLALNRLWRLNWPRERLIALGLQLGADVPFFLGGHNAWVEGIGENLRPIALPPQWLAVIKPANSIETRAIFSSDLLARNSKPVIVESFLAQAGIEQILAGFGCNVMQPPAEAQCAEVTQVANVLQARFGNSRMTGSGSAVFARAGTISEAAAQPVATLPADLPPGWVSRMCRSLEQHPLVGWCHD